MRGGHDAQRLEHAWQARGRRRAILQLRSQILAVGRFDDRAEGSLLCAWPVKVHNPARTHSRLVELRVGAEDTRLAAIACRGRGDEKRRVREKDGEHRAK